MEKEKLVYLYNFKQKELEKVKKESLYNLAQIYELEANYYEAEIYYKKAIDAGVKGACNQLGLMYLENKDIKKARQIFLKGEEMLDLLSMVNLALLYERSGQSVKAIELYKKAYDHGYRSKLVSKKLGVGDK